MAFGFGFNKQKVLSAAEKCVQQGKLQNAISEYEKILKHDAKDLTVMNTVGDLYSRLGEQDKAAECFKNVGDAYASQGFTVKAIAMYKKLSKLKPSMECVLRLAELYTQQGLFNDARSQYLQVAEDFLKSGQLDQAVRIFEKTLEMDPDNVAMRSKLAEVYVRLGKKEDAWKILSAAAESLRAKGQLAAADEILQRMLKIDPASSYALVLRGRAAFDSGDAALAIECLSKVADLDTNPEGLRVLFQAYLQTKHFENAEGLATKLATVHNDGAALTEYTNALLGAQKYREALNIYNQHADALLRHDPAKFSESLRGIIRHVQDDPDALEVVLALFQKSGENTHLTEIYELLAHAYVQYGNLEKARECYLKLMQMEPANQMHAKNYQQVLEKAESPSAPRQITAEEGAVLVDELEATAPFIEQHYKDDVALAIQSALTDAELFISYNMAQKALAPLLNALPRAPRDLRLNQKLAALHTRAGRLTEAAVCCRTLESIYHDAGHSEEATRYGDLAAKCEERSAGVASATAPQEQAAVPQAETTTVDSAATEGAPEFEISLPAADSFGEIVEAAASAQPATPTAKRNAVSGVFFHASTTPASTGPIVDQPAQAPEAHESAPEVSLQPSVEVPVEVDLSSEWESELAVEPPQADVQHAEATPAAQLASFDEQVAEAQPVSSVNLDEGIEEVRFYLGQGMTDHAEKVLERLENLAPGVPELAVLRLGLESAKQQIGAQPAEAEVGIEEATPADMSVVVEPEPALTESAPQPWPKEPPHAAPETPALQQMVSEIEHSLGDGFLPESQPAEAPEVTIEPEMAPAGEAAAPNDHQFRSGTLDEFVSDLEASLGSDFPAAEPVANTEAPVQEMHEPVYQSPVPLAQVAAPVARAAAAAATSAPLPAAAAVAQQHAIGGALDAQAVAAVGPGVDLADMFGELKHELEEGVATTDEDPETHYNLGVAFREMGLLDEAIGEFQKVCQAAEHGRAFSQLMQTYTWLAQCFLDKGVPEAAIRWYQQALKIPTLDQETRTALHYELASSFETAGNKAAALNNFLEVYGSNIDYRDVAERIKALRP